MVIGEDDETLGSWMKLKLIYLQPKLIILFCSVMTSYKFHVIEDFKLNELFCV